MSFQSLPSSHAHARDTFPASAALERALKQTVRGEVRFDAGARALYATDSSNYRQVPIGLVIPLDESDVAATIAACREAGAPILPRGAGTSLAGQCCNAAVVLDFSKYMHRVLEIDAGRRRARVEPGTILDHLRAAAEPYGLTFGPDPATHDRCTIGGMIGNNSCGVHSVLAEFYGPGPRTEHSVEALEVLTYDGARFRVDATSDADFQDVLRAGGRRAEIYGGLRDLRDRYARLIRRRFPDIPRRVSGYTLPELLPENGFHVARALVGSESTCAIVLEAEVTLMPRHPERALLVLGYPSVFEAGDHVPEIRRHRPIGIEGMDDVLVDAVRSKGLDAGGLRFLPDGRGWLLVEFGGQTAAEAADRARGVMAMLRRRLRPPSMRLLEATDAQARLWHIRESGLGATSFVPGERDTWEGWEDSAVAPDRIGDYLRDLRALLDRYGYARALYGHFGQGCVHTRIDFQLATAPGIERFRAFTREAAELVVHRHGGALSGEHGDGQARGDLLHVMYGAEGVEAFRAFKAIWDPEGRLNPGKVVDALPRDRALRLGADYPPPSPATHFAYREDEGDFTRAALRCVGVGKCRRTEGGTMCPSFMVLREEAHSTRGRAHLLFEMLQGDVVDEGWRSEAVKEALDLCLSCKACKGECPVNVDIATYKAEFLAHYYEGRRRPLRAYLFGMIDRWARLASHVPTLVNAGAQIPGVAGLAKRIAGIAPARDLPRFARTTFREWFAGRPAPSGDGAPVMFWVDTFNEHFHPDTARAAVEVLETAGCHIEIPAVPVCCGRPLYDFGMLDRARAYLVRVLDVLRPALRADRPVIVLEPSCASVFRDELPNLLPDDEDARRLAAQVVPLDVFLLRQGALETWPRLDGRAVVHGHCHRKAVEGMQPQRDALAALGLDVTVLDAGCCGMAGAFGFEREKYEVSRAAGERVLLPAVREAPAGTLIVADGFSCREQIAQLSGRRAVHVADVLRFALDGGTGEQPETRALGADAGRRRSARVGAIGLIGAGVLIAGAVARLTRPS